MIFYLGLIRFKLFIVYFVLLILKCVSKSLRVWGERGGIRFLIFCVISDMLRTIQLQILPIKRIFR